MASLSGGYNIKERERCINEILKNDDVLNGFLIDGLHNNGPEVELLAFKEFESIVEFIIVSIHISMCATLTSSLIFRICFRKKNYG